MIDNNEKNEVSLNALKLFVQRELENEKIDDAEQKAKIFIEDFLDINKTEYILKLNEDIFEILNKRKEEFFNKLSKIKQNIPIEYIINKKYIYESEFFVKEGVLIPRTDTEILIHESMKSIIKDIDCKIKEDKNIKMNIVDLCTGSGVVGISVLKGVLDYLNKKSYNKELKIYFSFVDISDIALEVVNINIKKILLEDEKYKRFNLKDKLFIIKSDLFEEFNKSSLNFYFDYILSNPPYIKKSDLKNLAEDVKKEPVIALDGGDDGLEFYKSILKSGLKYLNKDGKILFEIGMDQAEDIIDIVNNINKENKIYSIEKILKDMEGRDRVLKIKRIKV